MAMLPMAVAVGTKSEPIENVRQHIGPHRAQRAFLNARSMSCVMSYPPGEDIYP
jgi:hypothetical protein